MEVGQKVKVAGTKLEGVVVKIDRRREGSSTIKLFYTVKLTDGSEMELMRDEIRYA